MYIHLYKNLTNPSNPFNCMSTFLGFKEELCCCLAGWHQHKHHGEWNPADGESAHNDRHHQGDSANSLESLMIKLNGKKYLSYFVCIACSLLSFFSVLVKCFLDLRNHPSPNELLRSSSISDALNSWQLKLSSSVLKLEAVGRLESVVSLMLASVTPVSRIGTSAVAVSPGTSMNDTVETSWKSGTGTSLNETVEVFLTGSGRPAVSSDPVAMDSFLFTLFPFADEADNDFWPREEFVKNVASRSNLTLSSALIRK